MNTPSHTEKKEIVQQFVWGLARRHGWGKKVEFRRAVNTIFNNSRVGTATRVLRPLVKQHRIQFLGWSESDKEMIKLRVGNGRRVELAYYLRDKVGKPEFAIETTVSRFKDVDGGFDGTTEPDVTYVDWPE